jgi:hypothetical protein
VAEYDVSRMNAYETNNTPTVAKMNASGCLTRLGRQRPVQRHRGLGAMIAIDSDRLPEVQLPTKPCC